MDLQVETQTPALAPPPTKVYTHRDRLEILRELLDRERAEHKAAREQVATLEATIRGLRETIHATQRQLWECQREVSWMRHEWMPRRVGTAMVEVRK